MAGAEAAIDHSLGKRRVGKTELVKQFQGNKPHVYFLAESTNEKDQLHRFSQALGDFFTEPLLRTEDFRDGKNPLCM